MCKDDVNGFSFASDMCSMTVSCPLQAGQKMHNLTIARFKNSGIYLQNYISQYILNVLCEGDT
jgi:hypothetical protein